MNEVILIGRITSDVIYGKTKNNYSFARFTIAVEREGKTKTSEFIPVVAWYHIADFCSRNLSKGVLVSIRGAINTSTYLDKLGKNVFSVEVLINKLNILESKETILNRQQKQAAQISPAPTPIKTTRTTLNANGIKFSEYLKNTNQQAPQLQNNQANIVSNSNEFIFDLDKIKFYEPEITQNNSNNSLTQNTNENSTPEQYNSFMFDLDNIDKLD